MSKHAPGPWTVIPSCGPIWGTWIRPADVNLGPVARHCGDNADLIAAAPDLFHVLDELLRKTAPFVSALEAEDMLFDLEQWWESAQAAIAKARGES